MNCLVTGAAGFIGSNFIDFLSKCSVNITAIDGLLETTYPKSIKLKRWNILKYTYPEISFVDFDLRNNLEALLQINKFDFIFNFAALPGLQLSWDKFELYNNCNVLAVNNLCKAIVTSSINTKLIHMSTSSVYGKNATGSEDDNLEPFSPYGVTKLAAENLISAFASNYNLKFKIIRLFSVYGPRQRSDMALQIFCRSFIENKPIIVYGDGSQSRSPTFVKDCSEGIYRIAINSIDNEIYNLSGNETLTTLDAIGILEELFKKRVEIIFKPTRAGDQIMTRGNCAKLLKAVNYAPDTTFYSGIQQQINWNKSAEFMQTHREDNTQFFTR